MALTLKVKLPAVVGVPLSTPAVLNVKPGGSVPVALQLSVPFGGAGPLHGCALVVFDYSEFGHTSAGRLLRTERDREIITARLNPMGKSPVNT